MAFLALAAAAAGPAGAARAQASRVQPGRIVVYLLDHQYLAEEELATIQAEVDRIFRDAGIHIEWIPDQSPRRPLDAHELRVIILPSDGTRWFHGPSNAIGIAPHDAGGVGRNCFVFYRQAVWFRQQALLRCREATRVRAQAEAGGQAVDPRIDALAPPDCGSYLPSLTPLIVARAAAHEMVHILLNKLDHSPKGLMRDSFDVREWMAADRDAFRLGAKEVAALQSLVLQVAPERVQ